MNVTRSFLSMVRTKPPSELPPLDRKYLGREAIIAKKKANPPSRGQARRADQVISVIDIKSLLFIGYAVGYPLAVLPPIFLDLIISHVMFGHRVYEYAKLLCLLVYALLLGFTYFILREPHSLRNLYISVCGFLVTILGSLLIFLPELPHGNIFQVGVTTTFISAFSIFVWSIGNKTAIDSKLDGSTGLVTVDYIKTLFSFVRQGAFAAVALFGALFFAAYSTGFKFAEFITSDKSELFLLNLNLNMQIAFYVMYLIVGVVRYFFVMNLQILSQFENIARRLDREEKKSANRELPLTSKPRATPRRARPSVKLREPESGVESGGE